MRLLQFCELTREDWRKLKNATSDAPFVLTTEPAILLTVAGARVSRKLALGPTDNTEKTDGKIAGLECNVCHRTKGVAGHPFDAFGLKLHKFKQHGLRKAGKRRIKKAKGGE